MKEIISVKTGLSQIITDEVWDDIVARGWQKKYTMTPVIERQLKDVPRIIPAEIKTKTKKKDE